MLLMNDDRNAQWFPGQKILGLKGAAKTRCGEVSITQVAIIGGDNSRVVSRSRRWVFYREIVSLPSASVLGPLRSDTTKRTRPEKLVAILADPVFSREDPRFAQRGFILIGLTRGFMYADAPRVVASLWNVEDRATAELMKRFYEGVLKRQLRPSAALREAQLALKRDKRWSSPYYWAGFVLEGDWR
jgi:CHAT domain